MESQRFINANKYNVGGGCIKNAFLKHNGTQSTSLRNTKLLIINDNTLCTFVKTLVFLCG